MRALPLRTLIYVCCVLCCKHKKLAKDARAGSKYVYGGASPDTEAASKAAGHELKGNIN